MLSDGWIIKARVRKINSEIELIGEANYESGSIGGAIVILIIAVFFCSMGHHARIEGTFARKLDFAHRSGIFSAEFPKDLQHARSRRNSMVNKTHKILCFNSTDAAFQRGLFLTLYIFQTICALIVFCIIFAITDFWASWFAQFWITSHIIIFIESIFKCFFVFKKESIYKLKQTAFVALFDISLLVLIGISCITISSVETKNFNTLPKTRWVVVVIFAYLTFVLSGMSTFSLTQLGTLQMHQILVLEKFKESSWYGRRSDEMPTYFPSNCIFDCIYSYSSITVLSSIYFRCSLLCHFIFTNGFSKCRIWGLDNRQG